MTRTCKSFLLIAVSVWASGCFAGGGDTPTENAPAAKGASGVPMLSKEQLDKLPPEKRAQIEQEQAAMQNAAGANMQRRKAGAAPNGG